MISEKLEELQSKKFKLMLKYMNEYERLIKKGISYENLSEFTKNSPAGPEKHAKYRTADSSPRAAAAFLHFSHCNFRLNVV